MADIFVADMVLADMVCGRYGRTPASHYTFTVESTCQPQEGASAAQPIRRYIGQPPIRSLTDRVSAARTIRRRIVTSVVRATRQVNGRRQTYPSHHTHTP